MEFIYEIENALPKQICEIIIKRYQKDDRKRPSKTFSDTKDVRKSNVLNFSYLEDWKDVDDIIFDVFTKGFNKYKEYIKTHINGNGDESISHAICEVFTDLLDEGYFVQEYKTGEYYRYHIDDHAKGNTPRTISCILYLNTLEEDQGGCTEFIGGKKIRPIQGKLLMFPSGWTYIHRGAPVKNSGVKYTIGTWAI
jgi:hypothetical protein|tara:strand:+ start:41 stop:625 length:585 start_codon:yes stop_codon:yes gene_type:complete